MPGANIGSKVALRRQREASESTEQSELSDVGERVGDRSVERRLETARIDGVALQHAVEIDQTLTIAAEFAPPVERLGGLDVKCAQAPTRQPGELGQVSHEFTRSAHAITRREVPERVRAPLHRHPEAMGQSRDEMTQDMTGRGIDRHGTRFAGRRGLGSSCTTDG